MNRISVVLTTYNGEHFIEPQLRSILEQTHQPTEIVLVDDASTDHVCEIAEKLLQERGIPYRILKNESNMGYMRAFEKGLQNATGDYIAFSDQDDVWDLDKLHHLFGAMKNLESQHPEVPLLVFSDVKIVDRDLNVHSDSFNKTQKFHMEKTSQCFCSLCVQNVIPGMSMMINRKLKELATPFPEHTVHHDWWIALVCAHSGKIRYVDLPLVYYRQHGSNVLGANLYDDVVWFYRIRTSLLSPKRLRQYVFEFLKYEMYDNYRNNLKVHAKQKLDLAELFPKDRAFLQKLASCLDKGGIRSILWLIKERALPPSWQRKVFFCLSLLKKG